MADQVVRLEITGNIATVTLGSQANRNALSRQLLAEMHAAIEQATHDDGVRAVVLTHAGPTFCAGADLKERAAGQVPTGPATMVGVFRQLMHAPQPTIAVVRGSVRAGGIGLMAACDLVVVASDVTFAFTEVRLGVAPALISVPILQRCPWSKLAAPFLTGEVFDAAAAREMGLVTHVSGDVTATVDTLTRGILTGGPIAVAATKSLLRSDSAAERAAFVEMDKLSASLFDSPEGAEGMRSFAEHRPPNWVSR
ncbi:MAG: enoyl-CoA hydratase-related protein [Ilumatobacteraceae bacterium]